MAKGMERILTEGVLRRLAGRQDAFAQKVVAQATRGGLVTRVQRRYLASDPSQERLYQEMLGLAKGVLERTVALDELERKMDRLTPSQLLALADRARQAQQET